jgi:hypothetical protein
LQNGELVAELGAELRQGNSTHVFPEPLIAVLTQAYREAAARRADEQA